MRSNYWDGWKGLCIVAVVALHAIPSYMMFRTGSWKWYADVLIYQPLLFPVAIFLAIAGYFSLGRSGAVYHDSAGSYYRHRLNRILPPYLIWTAIYLLLQHRSDLRSIRDVSRDVLLGTGIGVGYFVIVLLQFVLLTPPLARLEKPKTHVFLMAGVFICGALLTYAIRFGFPRSKMAEFPFYCLPCIVWYPCYHLGLFVAKYDLAHDLRIRRYSAWLVPLYLSFVAAAMATGIYLVSRDYPLGISQLKASSLLAAATLFLFALSDGHRTFDHLLENNYLTFLGRESYVIYLAHLLFLPEIASVLHPSLFVHLDQPLDVLLVVVLTLMLSAMLAGLIRKLLPHHHQLLGA